jgi:hypothetical protein
MFRGKALRSIRGRKAIKELPVAFFLFQFRVFSLWHFKKEQSYRSLPEQRT